jgi:phosphoribosylanthranilate isomerase
MFHVKICGITTADDARRAASAGADAIGLNFVSGSPRHLTAAAARAVRQAVPSGTLVVGVFAGSSPDEIRRMAVEVGLDAIQLHGHLAAADESHGLATDPPVRCRDLAPLPVIRAVRLDPPSEDDRLAAARLWIDEARRIGHGPVMAIVDATVSRETAPGSLGGTGAVVDWEALSRCRPLDLPTALAGGLTPDNVAAAIRAARATAVDTASGVEASPGCKCPEKMRAFIAAARTALGLS